MSRRVVFLDKDGTIIEDLPYNVDPARITLMPGVAEGLPMLRDAGFDFVVITNQSGVARGISTEADQVGVERRIRELLGELGVEILSYHYCPHLPGASVAAYSYACECRKPEPGLLLRAAAQHRIDLHASWFVGDILNDVEAGHRVGARSVMVDVGKETEWVPGPLRVPEYTATDMFDAARYIVAHVERADDPVLVAGASGGGRR